MKRFWGSMMALTFLACLPPAVYAQSAIAGVVKDTTGAVLPGTTVEASSPVLLEKVRAVIVDGAGVYQIVNLPPGTYTVTFLLTGFSTVKREGLELPSDFTATVNAEMRVGSLEETVVVAGVSPIVDVQSTAKAVVVNRELLDLLPTGRTAQTAGALVPGIVMGAPDVGGSGAMSQNAQTSGGLGGNEITVTLDGIQLNGFCGDGSTQSYSNTQNYEEIVFQNTSAGADFSAGGVRQNMIPRRGGNTLSGSAGGFYTNRKWQGDALTPELVARGLRGGNKIDKMYNFEGGLGGKIIRDRLWFFGASRRIAVDRVIADTFYADGSPGIDEQYVMNFSLRLTAQISPRNQITAYYDRVRKYLGHDMQAGYDPATASRVWLPSKLYAQGQAKWTSTVSNKVLVEAGYSTYQAYRQTTYQAGIRKEYFTPEWYATANRNDTSLGTHRVAAPGGDYILEPARRFISGSVSYVTGSHNMKFGVQDNFGSSVDGTGLNADLRQIYQNGQPVSVAIYNTPVRTKVVMDANLGIYGQDAWTVRRMTVNYGGRWEYFRSSIGDQDAGAGRFVPARVFSPVVMPTWSSFSPRFGMTYDLFGNAKTALKFSANKFEASATDGLAGDYNPVRLQNVTVSWTDLNRDDIADGAPGCVYLTPGCEINMAQAPVNFGLTTPGCSVIYTAGSIPCGTSQVAPNVDREYSVQYSLSLQHELLPRVSVTAGYLRTNFYNRRASQNVLQSFSDYTPVQIASPMDGSVVTMYNVSTAKRNQILNVEDMAPERRMWNNSVELSFNARLGAGIRLFGGTLIHRTLSVSCDAKDNPNNLLYCDGTQNGKPWLNQFKLAGTIPLPAGFQASAAFQTYLRYLSTTTPPVGTQWQITPTTRYAANCQGPCTPGALVNPGMTVATMNVPLRAPGTDLSDRINQLDFTVGKWFTYGKTRIEPEFSIFNAFNSLAVYGVRSFNFGTTSYLQPSTVLQPRLFRIGMQIKW